MIKSLEEFLMIKQSIFKNLEMIHLRIKHELSSNSLDNDSVEILLADSEKLINELNDLDGQYKINELECVDKQEALNKFKDIEHTIISLSELKKDNIEQLKKLRAVNEVKVKQMNNDNNLSKAYKKSYNSFNDNQGYFFNKEQ